MSDLTHLDSQGRARMVDVTGKAPSVREAVARACVIMQPATAARILDNRIPKGDVFAVARLAGIMAAKKTGDLIPLCHPLALTGADLSFRGDPEQGRIQIEARIRTVGQTGVEMEALVAVSMAALAIYDMCKAIDREIRIADVELVEKHGGQSGSYVRGSGEGA